MTKCFMLITLCPYLLADLFHLPHCLYIFRGTPIFIITDNSSEGFLHNITKILPWIYTIFNFIYHDGKHIFALGSFFSICIHISQPTLWNSSFSLILPYQVLSYMMSTRKFPHNLKLPNYMSLTNFCSSTLGEHPRSPHSLLPVVSYCTRWIQSHLLFPLHPDLCFISKPLEHLAKNILHQS